MMLVKAFITKLPNVTLTSTTIHLMASEVTVELLTAEELPKVM